MLRVILFLKVEHDGAGLKHSKVIVVWVDKSWNTAIRVDLQKPILLLSVLGNINGCGLPFQVLVLGCQFVKHSQDWETIWCAGGIHLQRLHCEWSSC